MKNSNSILRNCWCGSVTATLELTIVVGEERRSFPLVRCSQCSVLCLYPAPDDNDLSPFYDEGYYGATPRKFVSPVADLVGWFQQRRADLVSRQVPDNARLLDVGCGNGGYLTMMRQRGYSVEGTEWTDASTQRVAKENDLLIHSGDLLTLNLPEKKFDAVSMWHVFEHLRCPHETLILVHSLLKPNGVLFLSLPNHDSWQAKMFGRAWFHLDPPRHLFGYGPKSLGNLLKNTGFEVESITTLSLEQNPFGFMQSVLNALGFPNNRAYGVLKSTEKVPLHVKMLDIFLLAVLAAPGFLFSFLAGIFRADATMTLVARASEKSVSEDEPN